MTESGAELSSGARPGSAPGARRRRIALTGFMGCGKSTVGHLLARQLGWHFYDLDEMIESRAALSIPAIFEKLGEPAFREIESEALERALGEVEERQRACVLALGGGTIVQPQNLAALRHFGFCIIWLRCEMEVLLARCAGIRNRPLFQDESSFRRLYAQRLPFYQAADASVDASAPPRRVVEEILSLRPAGALLAS